jgi:hypothetical protein
MIRQQALKSLLNFVADLVKRERWGASHIPSSPLLQILLWHHIESLRATPQSNVELSCAREMG